MTCTHARNVSALCVRASVDPARVLDTPLPPVHAQWICPLRVRVCACCVPRRTWSLGDILWYAELWYSRCARAERTIVRVACVRLKFNDNYNKYIHSFNIPVSYVVNLRPSGLCVRAVRAFGAQQDTTSPGEPTAEHTNVYDIAIWL